MTPWILCRVSGTMTRSIATLLSLTLPGDASCCKRSKISCNQQWPVSQTVSGNDFYLAKKNSGICLQQGDNQSILRDPNCPSKLVSLQQKWNQQLFSICRISKLLETMVLFYLVVKFIGDTHHVSSLGSLTLSIPKGCIRMQTQPQFFDWNG